MFNFWQIQYTCRVANDLNFQLKGRKLTSIIKYRKSKRDKILLKREESDDSVWNQISSVRSAAKGAQGEKYFKLKSG